MTRLGHARALRPWLESGGPTAGSGKKKKGQAPFLVLSDKVAIAGDDGNLALRAVRGIEAGELIVGVAIACALHPRSPVLSEARLAAIDQAAAAMRSAGDFRTPLLDAGNVGWLELVLLLALELLDGEASLWWPYLRTLPGKEHASPPSLWREVFAEGGVGDAAVGLLEGTSVGAAVAHDAAQLRALLHPGGDGEAAEVLRLVGGPTQATPEAAADALLRAVGLVSTRTIGGCGMVPLLDLANGVPTGRHNAKFERTNLAHSAKAAASEPCMAVLSCRSIAEGEEILCAYGEYSAADFLYRYGWIEGGPEVDAAAESPHEIVVLPPGPVWEALSAGQRSVLEQHGLGLKELEEGLLSSPLALPLQDAGQGAIPDQLLQVALIACCEDEATLRELAETGRAGAGKGATLPDIARKVSTWSAAQVRRLSLEGPPGAATSSVQAKLALRLRRGERERLLRWMMGLQNKHKLPKELWAGAMRHHVAACKGQPVPADEE